MKTTASAKFENKNKMAHSRFAISNQSSVEQVKGSSKKLNTLKATQTSLAELDDKTGSQPENSRVRA